MVGIPLIIADTSMYALQTRTLTQYKDIRSSIGICQRNTTQQQ